MRKTGEEALQFNGKDLGLRLCDFWSWGFSDLLVELAGVLPYEAYTPRTME